MRVALQRAWWSLPPRAARLSHLRRLAHEAERRRERPQSRERAAALWSDARLVVRVVRGLRDLGDRGATRIVCRVRRRLTLDARQLLAPLRERRPRDRLHPFADLRRRRRPN